MVSGPVMLTVTEMNGCGPKRINGLIAELSGASHAGTIRPKFENLSRARIGVELSGLKENVFERLSRAFEKRDLIIMLN